MKTLLSCALLCAALLSCNRSLPVSETIGGGGSEVEVRGMLYDNAGKPASAAQVRLFNKNFNPVLDDQLDECMTAATDAAGRYCFHAVKADTYNIVALHPGARTRAIVAGVAVSGTDTVTAPAVRVDRCGTITIALADSVDTVSGYVYIPGTAIVAYSRSSTGYITLDSVPPGTIPAVAYGVKNRPGSILRYGVTVDPGETTVIANPAWKYARRLYCNTTASGAGVSVGIAGYPVLVRLTKNNFDFSQAGGDGADLRFCKSDNSALAFEIERWDSSAQRAEVWVMVDTVYGNDSSHYMTMFWGNRAAASASSPGAVFDTALGIVVAMHCNADCIDATLIHNAATNFGATAVEGLIGMALQFDGTDSVRIPGLLGKPSSLTIGAWVQSSTPPKTGYEIVSLGGAIFTGMDFLADGVGTFGCFHETVSGADTLFCLLGSGRYLCDGQWHYVAYTYDAVNKIQTLYIDGQVSGVQNSSFPINYSGMGINTLIGKHGNGSDDFNFIGKIDEIRISKACRSACLFKLNYMSQKPDAKLVAFK